MASPVIAYTDISYKQYDLKLEDVTYLVTVQWILRVFMIKIQRSRLIDREELSTSVTKELVQSKLHLACRLTIPVIKIIHIFR